MTEAVEIEGPLAAGRALAGLPRPFLLHSSAPGGRARWSFFGAEPFAVFGAADYDAAQALWRGLVGAVPRADSLPPEIPFAGGVVGYWAYDFGRRLERLPNLAADDLGLPDVVLAFYDVIGAFDHETGRAWLVSSGLPLEPGMRAGRARDRLVRFAGLL
ncbi:MAG: aminodeoxychorismate synthase, component I, partial [Candidatus Eiseniibacteriota bacterium]